MDMKRWILLALFACGGWGFFSCSNQREQPKQEPELPEIQIEEVLPVTTSNIRGLFMVNDSVGWASGSSGTFLRFTNGIWIADSIPNYTHLDFRDVHAFDKNTALLMAAGEEGRILRTEDGGKNWNEVYTNLSEGIFLDGMDFHDNIGYCYGDPINGKFVLVKSEDFGKTWNKIEPDSLSLSLAKEAGFAASGTGIIVSENNRIVATGGDTIARIVKNENDNDWTFYNTPIRSSEGCGIFSVTQTKETLVAVGGCYLDSTNRDAASAVSFDNGTTWKLLTENGVAGYRSCVAYSNKAELLIACGRTGIDISRDFGESWETISKEGYYTCSLVDSTGWLMGKRGKMAQISW